MDTDLLRAFVTVAECEGFSAAGKILNRTQSAVSLQIKRLEERVGDHLFDRNSRNVVLTDAGGRMLPHARKMLRLQDEIERVMSAAAPGELIRLGISEEQASAYLPELLSRFSELHPHARVEVACDMSGALVATFQEGLLDVVLAVRHSPTQTGQLLGSEPMVWVVREDCSPCNWETLPLALNPEGCIFRAHAFAALGRADRRCDVRYTSASPTGVNVAVQSGLAVAVKTPRSVPAGCRIVRDDEGLPALGHVEIELHRSPGQVTEAVEAFCANLADIVTQSQTLQPLTSS